MDDDLRREFSLWISFQREMMKAQQLIEQQDNEIAKSKAIKRGAALAQREMVYQQILMVSVVGQFPSLWNTGNALLFFVRGWRIYYSPTDSSFPGIHIHAGFDKS